MNNNFSIKEKHLNFLKKVGFLINYNELELYHGRGQTSDEEWHVRSDVDNSYNKNPNNIMGIPCLCVASYNIAESYAKGTTLNGRTGKMKIHEIVSNDDDALIANEKFDIHKLPKNHAIKFHQAIQSLTNDALKRYLSEEIQNEVLLDEIKRKYNEYQLISEDKEKALHKSINSIAENISENTVANVIGAINSTIYFQKFPVSMISIYVFDKSENRNYITIGNEKYRINQDYIRNILDRNKIIGLNKKAYSGDKDHIVYIFNLSKVKDAEPEACQENV